MQSFPDLKSRAFSAVGSLADFDAVLKPHLPPIDAMYAEWGGEIVASERHVDPKQALKEFSERLIKAVEGKEWGWRLPPEVREEDDFETKQKQYRAIARIYYQVKEVGPE